MLCKFNKAFIPTCRGQELKNVIPCNLCLVSSCKMENIFAVLTAVTFMHIYMPAGGVLKNFVICQSLHT